MSAPLDRGAGALPAALLGAVAPAPPLVTLTLQPSLDVSYEVEHLVEDRKLHASRYRVDPGGNGINVARALQRLGLGAHACLVSAGEVGELLERLLREQVRQVHATRCAGETRINATVEQSLPPAQYEVIGQGPRLPDEVLHEVQRTVYELGRGGVVALTGSVPEGVATTLYADMARELRARGARVVLDMQGEALAAAVREGPWLIKPNRWELEQLVGRELPTLRQVCDSALELQRGGVEQVCVSLGAEGAVLACAGGLWHGPAPRVDVRSTVGAGDSMLAGLLAALACGAEPAQALRLGLACGSGTSAQPGTELFDPAALPDLLRRTEVTAWPGAALSPAAAPR